MHDSMLWRREAKSEACIPSSVLSPLMLWSLLRQTVSGVCICTTRLHSIIHRWQLVLSPYFLHRTIYLAPIWSLTRPAESALSSCPVFAGRNYNQAAQSTSGSMTYCPRVPLGGMDIPTRPSIAR
ncbi:uncharacterized protein B0J16DRAFT_6503 [Fusarium flagelliforme]|uniref:uncharacterized protein n=1 Tax=Fusarium flagelliforme TaxID=2675880 RepID=UPI001E8DA571|nr:uncharacterized protein B0J16DRAFT_6503 [Fusarium flagelliforme]KAH7196806.1 hypothetical protein B0J16DRAFT_6503 [Fusarium flagelliforme]